MIVTFTLSPPRETLDVAPLGVEIVVACLRTELDLPHVYVDCFLRAALRACSFWYLYLP